MHQDGNNIESLKTFRALVRLFNEPTTGGTNTFGRYYFDEIPQLQNKIIVGFNVDLNPEFGVLPGNLWLYDYTKIVGGLPAYNANAATLAELFLNIYNDRDELIMENFPCLQATSINLNSGNWSTPKKGEKKVFPLNTKIKIKQSFIFGNSNFTQNNIVVSINFYYK